MLHPSLVPKLAGFCLRAPLGLSIGDGELRPGSPYTPAEGHRTLVGNVPLETCRRCHAKWQHKHAEVRESRARTTAVKSISCSSSSRAPTTVPQCRTLYSRLLMLTLLPHDTRWRNHPYMDGEVDEGEGTWPVTFFFLFSLSKLAANVSVSPGYTA